VYYSVEVVDRNSGATLAVVVEAVDAEAARARVVREGRVVGKAAPAIMEIESQLGSQPRPSGELERRPVWTIARGIWLGMCMTAVTGFGVSVLIWIVTLLGLGVIVSSCQPPTRSSGDGARSSGR